ncbi:hypothetical protein L6164_002484 [Bauhinia variegata]|uniref:Uncharacterized protein n=1 Tax=Bauhinia variegata TaxID=167791 RepID=A0ACB9PYD1_BAUVA|nr:hypothetical protein L6164_002484 [Bauhinia variegata]
MANLKVAMVLLMCVAVMSAPITQAAITCGAVAGKVAPCIGYLTNKAPNPSAGCCSGVKSLLASAATTADRQTVCNCLKSSAGSISGLNYAAAGSLPGKCGVSIPYKISPSTNCATIK